MDSNRVFRAVLSAALCSALYAVGYGCGGPPEFRGFRTSDGFTIAADLHLPDPDVPAPLTLLGHQLARDRRSWDPLVPRLVDAGWAVVTVDHRGFGESVREAASPDDLDDLQKAALHLDLLGALDALADHPRIDPSRVVVFGAGISANAAVRCARENPSVRGLVLFVGLLEAEETEFLIERPDLPLLIVVDSRDRRGVTLTRQYARRFTGPKQLYFELPPVDSEEDVRWRGTDGLTVDSGLADVVLWFLDRAFSP